MGLDVTSETVVRRPREVVAAYAVDPDRTTTWYRNIRSVERVTPPPLAVGSELRFVAAFAGRRLEYVYRVLEWVPGERFVMATAQGPFPMRTTYTWDDVPGGTRMRLRNTGEPTGFSRLVAPLLARMVARATAKDLRTLARVLEQDAAGPRA